MNTTTSTLQGRNVGTTITTSQKNLLIVLIGCVAALGPFTIDMYLPGFPAMADFFSTNEKNIAYTLTSFFIGISIGQIIHGPMLDRFGRKSPLLVGLAIYLIASIACAGATSLSALIVFRFVQALGGSVGMVAGTSIIRDLFDTKEVARMFSAILLVMGVAPIIAPTLGSFVVHQYGWKAIFIFLTIVSGLLMVALYFFLNAGNGPDRSKTLKVKRIASNYREILMQRNFLYYTLAGSIAMAIMFAYISSIPFILMSIYGVSETTFGWLFGLNAFGFIFGSQVNRYALMKFEIVRLTNYTSALSLLLASGFLSVSFFVQLPLGVFCAFLFLTLFLLGFVNPNATALSMDRITDHVGLASALNGCIRMGAGAVVSGVMGLVYNGTIYPLITMIFLLTVLSVLCLYAVSRNRSVDVGEFTMSNSKSD